MAGGYVTPDKDSFDRLVREMGDMKLRIRELEKPTGTQSASTVAYLAGLITRGEGGSLYESGDIPGDSTTRYETSTVSVTLAVPTGRALVTVGSSMLLLRPGDLSAEAQISFTVTNEGDEEPWWPEGTRSARAFSGTDRNVGMPVNTTQPITVASHVNQIFTLSYGAWSSSAITPASFRIDSPYINVQVIDEEVE